MKISNLDSYPFKGMEKQCKAFILISLITDVFNTRYSFLFGMLMMVYLGGMVLYMFYLDAHEKCFLKFNLLLDTSKYNHRNVSALIRGLRVATTTVTLALAVAIYLFYLNGMISETNGVSPWVLVSFAVAGNIVMYFVEGREILEMILDKAHLK